MASELSLERPISLPGQLSRALPLTLTGAICIAAGGMVSAVTASTPSENASWSAAYLVLVAGVAQVGLGMGQALLSSRPVTRRMVAAQFTAWNLGNGAVITGTLVDVVWLVDVGGALLVVALTLVLLSVRKGVPHRTWLLHGFRLLVAVLLVSIPIGLLLARVEN